jgi:NAD(P)-dependent dehydrogenase (short-subunit alcohol dehydrogenase family)
VNAVSPGPIETPIFGKVGLPAKEAAELVDGISKGVPLGRIGAAEEVAAAATFLASGEASFITGSEIAVDGGFAQV